MRVTSGIRKGALLMGAEDLSIRPTTDKVKQAVFNMIQFEIPGRTVLDLFAGSGGMGIEALSRGAKYCTFVDIEPSIVKKNIAKVRFEELSEIVKTDYQLYLEQTNTKYDLIFLDPPYGQGMISIAMEKLVSGNLLMPGSLIVWEYDTGEEISVPKEIRLLKERSFGRIQIRIGAFE